MQFFMLDSGLFLRALRALLDSVGPFLAFAMRMAFAADSFFGRVVHPGPN